MRTTMSSSHPLFTPRPDWSSLFTTIHQTKGADEYVPSNLTFFRHILKHKFAMASVAVIMICRRHQRCLGQFSVKVWTIREWLNAPQILLQMLRVRKRQRQICSMSTPWYDLRLTPSYERIGIIYTSAGYYHFNFYLDEEHRDARR